MSELISGIVSQHLQQAQENQALKQNQTQPTGGKSFESHLQDQIKAAGDGGKADQTPSTSNVDKLEQIQAELQKNVSTPNADSAKMTELLKEIMSENGGRMSMLKEAYDKIGKSGKVPSDLRGNLINTEQEWNAVQQIMNSDKNLTQGELLALQQRLYMVSQHVEVMSKVVDQMAGGIKTVLNTNI